MARELAIGKIDGSREIASYVYSIDQKMGRKEQNGQGKGMS
jgi:hypothetical protein